MGQVGIEAGASEGSARVQGLQQTWAGAQVITSLVATAKPPVAFLQIKPCLNLVRLVIHGAWGVGDGGSELLIDSRLLVCSDDLPMTVGLTCFQAERNIHIG